MKTEMTSVDVAALVYELNQTIKDSRIENIYQINQTTLLLRLHKPNQPTMQLLIEAGKRVHLTSYIIKKPLKPPAFCMTLRKHLRNGKITEIPQHEFERTIVLKISTKEGVFQLICELFGEGNIILVSPQGSIVSAHTYKKMRDRNILRNETYKHPPPSGKNPFEISREQMSELRNFGQLEIVRALTKFLSIGGFYAEELLLRADVEKNTPCESLTEHQLDNVYGQLQMMLSQLSEGKLEPAIIINAQGEWTDVTPFRLKRYEGLERKPHKTLNEALDEFYTKTTVSEKVSTVKMEYERELAKQQRMLQDQQKTMEDSGKAIEQNKRLGDLLYAHLSELQFLVQQIQEEKQKGEKWEQIVNKVKEEKQKGRPPAVYFDSLDSKSMILNVSIDGNTCLIELNLTVQANAAEYYERMKKAERKLEGAQKALRETQLRIQELQRLQTEKVEEARSEEPQKHEKKAWYEKFRWFESSDDFLVVGGKDATTNEILIKKYLEPDDIVFHADVIGSPFVVVKTNGKVPSEQVKREAAQFAVSYSRAWREMFSAADVYWVHPHQISKTPPSGQYLQKGSFMIQGSKNYVRSVPLRIGIGVKVKNEHLVVICGPAECVSRQTGFRVEVVPGRRPGSELVKQIRRMLVEKVPRVLREKVISIPNEQFQGVIPFGKGEVILK